VTAEATGNTEPSTDPSTASAAGSLAGQARRIPFTLGVVGLMLLLGLATQTLWSPLEDRPLLDTVAYGLPALQDGRWWTPVTGAFFALVPAQYLPVAGGALLLVGWSELRLGTRRVAIASITCHLVGVLGAALVLLPLSQTAWDWAARTATVLDVGFSAGALGAVAAASATLAPPWRGRLRIVLSLYAVLAFLYIGLLWDLEHLLAILAGFAVGPFLVGSRPTVRPVRFTRHEWRILAFTLFLVSAVVRVLLYFVPSDGPLGATTDDADVFGVLVGAAVSLLLANGLRRGSRRVWHLAGALTTLGLLSAVAVLVEVLVPDQLDPTDTDQVLSPQPQLVVDILLWAVQLWVLLAGRAAFRARSGRRQRAELTAAQNDRETAVLLLKQCGGTTMSWMGTWEDNLWFVLRDPSRATAAHVPVTGGGPPPADASDERAPGSPGGDAAGGAQPLLDPHAVGYVAHQVHRGVSIALGDAVAPDAGERRRVLEAFVEDQESKGRQVCFFSVTDEVRQWGAARGYRDVVVAEEALIDLPTLEFRGKRWQDVRTALNRAAKEGVSYREGRLADMPRGLLTQVRAISELWVGDKGLPEMGFTLGGVDEALDRETVVGLAVDTDQTVHGVTSWLPVYAGAGRVRGWTLDVMRRLPDGFRPVTEFLIASACLSFKDQGAEVVSLSGAPLAHAGQSTAGSEPLDRLLGTLGESLEPLYGFRSLESFKQKFQPRNEPVHLVFRDEAALPRIGLALTAAYLPGTSMRRLAAAGLRARQEA
jgi:phosphatidylglycerol lysyltransferase